MTSSHSEGRSELEFFYQDGASHIFPDAWEGYLAPIPEHERGDMIAAYYKYVRSTPHPLATANLLENTDGVLRSPP